jgi:hypothetical protein
LFYGKPLVIFLDEGNGIGRTSAIRGTQKQPQPGPFYFGESKKGNRTRVEGFFGIRTFGNKGEQLGGGA